MAGRLQQETSMVTAMAAHDWNAPEGKVQFARVVLSRIPTHDGPVHTVALAGLQGSHALGSLARSNALAVIPADVTSVRAGDQVSCIPLAPVLEAS
jgi:molybdopterin molybdotransferase